MLIHCIINFNQRDEYLLSLKYTVHLSKCESTHFKFKILTFIVSASFSAKVKHWELDLVPNSFHVDELTDDEIYEELLETRKLLANANRKIEALKYEANYLREQLTQLSMDDDNLSDESLLIEEKDDARKAHSTNNSTLTHRNVAESTSDPIVTQSNSQQAAQLSSPVEDLNLGPKPAKRCQCIIL